MAAITATDTHRTIDAVWRIESARLIGLARIVRDVGLAEELAQDALVAALEQWTQAGVPASPGAWLMATAKHRAIDRVRRDRLYERKLAEIGRDRGDGVVKPDPDSTLDDDIGDNLLNERGRAGINSNLLCNANDKHCFRRFHRVYDPPVGGRSAAAQVYRGVIK